MLEFSHLDKDGRARMVNTSEKPVVKRMAKASGKIFIAKETRDAILQNLIKKGDVLTVAEIAGIQAAKKTAELIPLCHTLILDKVALKLQVIDNAVLATSEVYSVGRTGVEMEALTAVSIALLTVYDMCKAIDKNMRLGEIVLIEKIKE